MSNDINYTSITKTRVKETKIFKAFRSVYIQLCRQLRMSSHTNSPPPLLLAGSCYLLWSEQTAEARDRGGAGVWRAGGGSALRETSERKRPHMWTQCGRGSGKQNATVSEQQTVKNVIHKLQATCCGRTGFRGKAAEDTLIFMHQAR